MSSVCNSVEWQLIHRVILEPSGRKWELQQAGIRFEAKVLNVTFPETNRNLQRGRRKTL